MNNIVPYQSDAPAFGAGQEQRPPVNYEAEQMVLAAILASNSAYDHVCDFLSHEHFADSAHGRIYQVSASIIDKGGIADAITIKRAFEGDGNLSDVGGAEYLAELQSAPVPTAYCRNYGEAVRDLYIRRQLMQIGRDAAAMAADTSDLEASAQDLVEQVEQSLYSMAAAPRTGGLEPLAEGGRGWVEQVHAAVTANRDGRVSGITTGLLDLDQALLGLNTRLYVLAGRPAMGKSALALNIARAAAEDGKRVGFWSLEMPAEELNGRLIAEYSGIPFERQQSGRVNAEEFDRIIEAQHRVAALPLHIDTTPQISAAAIRARARRHQRRHGLDLIIIDYLQLMSASASAQKKHNKVAEVSEISANLKAISKELDVPVIALSQLSRAVEQRDDKRPQLADLRESGTIEQDADAVMFCYREEYYHAQKEPKQRDDEDDEKFNRRLSNWTARKIECAGMGQVIIAKNRQGRAPQTVNLVWDGDLMRWGNLETRYG